MITDIDPLIEALTNHLQVTLNYTKKNGEVVTHTGGIYEIGTNKAGNAVIWLFDTQSNDHIRQFLISNIDSFQILDTPFSDTFGWGFKLNGDIIP